MSEEQGLTPYETREILFYKTENGEVRVEILLFQENLWLTQAKMAELFEVQKAALSTPLKKIFESGGTLTIQLYLSMSKAQYDAAFGIAAVLLIIVLFINLLTKILAKKFDVSKLD